MSLSKRVLSLLPESIQVAYGANKNKVQTALWERKGKSIPVPHAIKQEMINRYRDKYNIRTFVESGTYLGDMVWAQRNNFDNIYSIELSKDLVDFNRKRFKEKPHIRIILGDSGKIMHVLIKDLPEKTLFWLDGHYSGAGTARGDKDCPVLEEVKAILSAEEDHVLIIGDARSFTGQRDYPTLEGLSAYILRLAPFSRIQVENDCIVVELKKRNDDV